MSINSFPVGHLFGPYEIILDDFTSSLYSKAIINRKIETHSPFAIVSMTFGKLLADINLEEGAIHLNQTINWVKKFDEKERIVASAKIVSKTERRNNFFIKIKIEYMNKLKNKLGESISTILINNNE